MDRSVRGRSGGYRLARSASEISVWELFESVEGFLEPVQCISHGQTCDLDVGCLSQSAWKAIFSRMKQSLDGLTIADLLSGESYVFPEAMTTGVYECRPPTAGTSL